VNNEKFNSADFVTGSIMSLLGHADVNGFFVVKDFCYSGIPFKSELPPQIKPQLGPHTLFSNPTRSFIAFTSGFLFGGISEPQETALWALAYFLRGEHPNPAWNKLSSQV